jgi:spermidine export protein MdtI
MNIDIYLGYVVVAAIVEVLANVLLQKSNGFKNKKYAFLALLMVCISFTLLAQAVKGMELAVAYATWGAIGILGTALCGRYIFRQKLSKTSWLGVIVMMAAVIVLNTA